MESSRSRSGCSCAAGPWRASPRRSPRSRASTTAGASPAARAVFSLSLSLDSDPRPPARRTRRSLPYGAGPGPVKDLSSGPGAPDLEVLVFPIAAINYGLDVPPSGNYGVSVVRPSLRRPPRLGPT